MSKVCGVCQAELTRQLTNYTQLYQGRMIVVENVPAWVCEQCGEVYFDPDVVDRIQRLIWSDSKPTRFIETPVYDLSLAS